MHITYVIKSINNNYKYIGITDNLERRFNQHNNGWNKTTKPYAPFRLILIEEYPDRKSALIREKQLKSGFGRELVDKIIKVG